MVRHVSRFSKRYKRRFNLKAKETQSTYEKTRELKRKLESMDEILISMRIFNIYLISFSKTISVPIKGILNNQEDYQLEFHWFIKGARAVKSKRIKKTYFI